MEKLLTDKDYLLIKIGDKCAWTFAEIPEDLLLYMEYEDELLEKFERYTDDQKKASVDWVNAAKSKQTQA